MMHGGLKTIIGMTTWLLTALAALHMGFLAFNYDIFVAILEPLNLLNLMRPLYYLMGVAGVISLSLFVMACIGHGCGCGSKSCKCK